MCTEPGMPGGLPGKPPLRCGARAHAGNGMDIKGTGIPVTGYRHKQKAGEHFPGLLSWDKRQAALPPPGPTPNAIQVQGEALGRPAAGGVHAPASAKAASS